jgi:4-cresol dehydrogenase (hydroxylating)
MRPLRVSNLVANCNLMMSASYQLAMFKRRNEIVPDGAPLDDASVKKAAKANGLGMWNTYFALYGTDETIAGVEPIIRASLTASGGEVLTAAEMGDNPWFHHHQTLMQGGLNLDEIGLLRWRGSGADWPGSLRSPPRAGGGGVADCAGAPDRRKPWLRLYGCLRDRLA